ncbi:hypothetical protein OHS33_39495 (plasmid) [Streptomyces sp. NBC_00536]|uniref:hypothetical protein n=1 Tax=Streptomyces sp. NBC_00536 TaxID=2975769 RepID=UPI002E80194B|nr:hypothetical protein [Streptomyces sp. NBC_00536]WUC84541.1 hypothetical protein OHS33_39495 [Streptomyces sp. NBC_00536]
MGTYLEDVAAALRERRAWTCICGASNPDHYDACHDCQRPSWTCATCGTVNPQACSTCNECGGDTPDELLGDAEEGYEMTHAEFVNLQVGPRVVGGRYRLVAGGEEYEVIEIDRGPRATWPSWQITVRWATDGRETTHCTGWDDRRDSVASGPATRMEGSC